ncbi:MAG TPA: VOC family protein [Candidatus Bathyarchaeia archaeon]|nr:VOC family protein [Candidatus Bathyarchaeia archaeon]
MAREQIEFLSAVLLVSRDPKRLADFYRDVIGVPLREERHGASLPHWGCNLGEIHFAIHPIETFPDRQSGTGSVKLAFTVFDIQALVRRLEASGISLLYRPRDTGFFWSTAIHDPDGNMIEFTQLSDPWFHQLEARRAQGDDVVTRWRRTKEAAS